MGVEELGSCRVQLPMHLTSLSPASPSAAAAAMHSSKSYPDDTGGGTWEYFPCPYCYVEVEVRVLCTHLQEEHCFDMTNAVCPICAAYPEKDMIQHMTVQHSYLLKRRKSQSMLKGKPESVGKTLCKRGSTFKKKGSSSDYTPDPLLSSFISRIYSTDSKDLQDANSDASTEGSASLHMQSLDPSTNQVLVQDYEVRSQKASFAQQMLWSTIF